MKIKNLKGECQHCGGAIEFHAETAGMTADCPHCGQATELLLAAPPEAAAPTQTKAIVFTLLAAVILLGGLLVTVMVLKRAERLSSRQKEAVAKAAGAAVAPPANPFAQTEFSVSAIVFEPSQSGSIIHAVGELRNLANRQRFGVRIDLELLDDAGRKVGAATDYRSILEPTTVWRFRALVVDKRAVAAKVLRITEAE